MVRLCPALVLLALFAATAALPADPREVALGREVAEGAVLPPEKTCSRCHGVLGIGRPEEDTPRLAGQPRLYLQKQLDDFAAGTRVSEKMTPVARALADEQQRAVAAYYASLYAIPYPGAPYGEPSLVQEGGVLSAVGDAKRGIGPASCATPMAASASRRASPTSPANTPTTPQSSCCCGRRASGATTRSRSWPIARRLEDEEVQALALYFARVRPPPAALSSPIPEAPIPPPPAAPAVSD
jgi:cytochrome c553